MGRQSREFEGFEEDYTPKTRERKRPRKPQKPTPLTPAPGTGRFAYLAGTQDLTPETPQAKMLRMLQAQHPEGKTHFPESQVSQSQLRETLRRNGM